MKLVDITNNVYGNLTVISRHGATDDKKATWLCLCSCGRTVVKRGKQLRKSKDPTLNCGLEHPTKVCPSCFEDKPKSEYHLSSSNANGLQPKCKSCASNRYISEKDVLKKKYKDNCKKPEFKRRLAINSKKSRDKHKEKAAKYKLEYTKREDVKERRKEIHTLRKERDINYVIKRRLRGRVRDTLKYLGKGHKHKSSLFLLGCDTEFLKKYIENKFTEGMNWDNIREWHIDHIKPCSKFDLTKIEEQKLCFHYTNLQPLWWDDNLRKGTKYPFLIQQKV